MKTKPSIKRSFSNNVLIDQKGNYYLPCYLRFVLKQVCDVNIQQAKASMSATLVLSIYYKGIPQYYLKDLQESVQLMFGNQEKVNLITTGENSNSTMTRKKKQHLINYFYRGKFPLKVSCPSIFFTPFETIELKINITIRSINCIDDKDSIKLKFNLMDNQDFSAKFSTTMVEGQGQFGIASILFSVQFQNQKQIQKNKKKKMEQLNRTISTKKDIDSAKYIQNQTVKFYKKINNWQYANYTISFYRYPGITILTIFLPLWLLAFINLNVYFTPNDLATRLQNIGGLMIAYTAFLPTIRQRMPPSSKITLTDILIYALILTTLLCCISSLHHRQQKNQDQSKNGFFIISVIVDVITIAAVMILLILYKIIWQPSYKSNKMQNQIGQFRSIQWKNFRCDEYFLDKCQKIMD